MRGNRSVTTANSVMHGVRGHSLPGFEPMFSKVSGVYRNRYDTAIDLHLKIF